MNPENLAVIDWGVGGLSIIKVLKHLTPSASYTYVSDSGHPPYGLTSEKDLIKRTESILSWLSSRGITYTFIGCNTVSTLMHKIKAPAGMTISGMIPHCQELLNSLKAEKTAVFASKRTAESGIYSLNDKIMQCDVQPLSTMIENSSFTVKDVAKVIKPYMKDLKYKNNIFLGCTHYPAMQKEFEELLPHVDIINPSEFVACWIANNIYSISGQQTYFCTGDRVKMKNAAEAAFGIKLKINALSEQELNGVNYSLS